MPVFPLYRATRWLEDTWDEHPDMALDPEWSFVPIPDSVATGKGRHDVHIEGGESVACWFRGEIGSRIEQGATCPVFVTRTAPSGLLAYLVAKHLETGGHGIKPAEAPETTKEMTADEPERNGTHDVGEGAGVVRGLRRGQSDRAVRLPAIPGDPVVEAMPGVDPGSPPDGRPETYAWSVWRLLVRDHRQTQPATLEELDKVTRAGLAAGDAAAAIASARAVAPQGPYSETVNSSRRMKPTNPRQATLF